MILFYKDKYYYILFKILVIKNIFFNFYFIFILRRISLLFYIIEQWEMTIKIYLYIYKYYKNFTLPQ